MKAFGRPFNHKTNCTWKDLPSCWGLGGLFVGVATEQGFFSTEKNHDQNLKMDTFARFSKLTTISNRVTA